MIWIPHSPLHGRHIIGITVGLGVIKCVDIYRFRIPFINEILLIWTVLLLFELLTHGINIKKASFWVAGKKLEVIDFFFPLNIRQSTRTLSSGTDGIIFSKEYLYKNEKWAYFDIIRKIFLQRGHIRYKSVLILGIGGGVVLKTIHALNPNIYITGVEKYTQCLHIARTHFHVKETKQVSMVQKDAYSFVCNTNKYFDFVFMDIFHGDMVPRKFSTPPYLKSIFGLSRHVVINCGPHYNNLNQLINKCRKYAPIYVYGINNSFLLSTIKLPIRESEERFIRVV